MLDKITGGLFGVAIGDALGGTTEFMTPEGIMVQHGWLNEIVGGGFWCLHPGETTDDTAMTVAVARGILADPEKPLQHIGQEFMKWAATKPADIGNIIRSVFKEYQSQGDWFRAAETVHINTRSRSAGNGSLMRCLPVALAYADSNKMDQITRLQSKMTHWDYLATEACLINNRIAGRILNGEGLKDAVRSEVTGTRYEPRIDTAPTCNPTGYVVDTMEWVVHLLLTSDTFEDTVERAANAGYDSDTVAAIAGGLAGLEVGYEALPNKYKEKILLKEELIDLAERLNQIRNNPRG